MKHSKLTLQSNRSLLSRNHKKVKILGGRSGRNKNRVTAVGEPGTNVYLSGISVQAFICCVIESS